jgi:hypothetical protein
VKQTLETNAVPPITDLQRRQALAHANEVRTARKHLKEELRQGTLELAPLIAEYPPFLATARISDLLQALPGYGTVKVGKLLSTCRVSPSKTVAGLTPRQRKELVEAVKK